MTNDTRVAGSAPNAEFERKVRLSRTALFIERVWPRIWALGLLVALFVLVSLAGLWSHLPEWAHLVLLGVFGLAALAALVWIARTPAASREQAIRRIEQTSGVPHRPASSYEDHLTVQAGDGATQSLWAAHRERISRQLSRLRVGRPEARTDRFDPFALRALLLLGVGLMAWFAGDSAADRLRAAIRLGPAPIAVDSRLDAWVTPPAYTGVAPIILADGARLGLQPLPAANEKGEIEIPERSQLVVRGSGAGTDGFSLEITPENGVAEVKVVKPEDPQADGNAAHNPNLPPALKSDVAEVKLELKQTASVRVVGRPGDPWKFRVIPDKPPTIALTKEPQRLPRGSLKLTYQVSDDYGVVSAEGRITRAKPQEGDPATNWARRKANKGARPPLERPPALSLRLPRANAKEGEAFSYHELTSHPWAGSRVRLQLSAKDHAGQIGRSDPVELILPQRRFVNPIARAVVEQRRYLVEDPRNRETVGLALDSIALEPEGFIRDRKAFLGLRSAYWRLQRDRSRAGMKSVVDPL